MLFLHPHFSHLHRAGNDAHIVRFEQFSDGWPRIFLEEKEKISWQEITYIGDFRYVDDFFGQVAFLDWLMRYDPDFLHIHVPFFPAASMERDTPSGELSIANVFARMLGVISERKPGHVHVHLYDIHDEREIFYFPPSLQVHHHTTTDIFKREVLKTPLRRGEDSPASVANQGGSFFEAIPDIEQNPSALSGISPSKGSLPIILFPDAGAKKAFSRFFTDYEIVTCAKIRKSPTEIEMYFEWGDLKGRDVWIIDDHIRSGGTLVEAARYAREKWARSVSAFAPHGVFADGVKPEFLEAFEAFVTTDTIPGNLERFRTIKNTQVLPFLG